jgi:hypothetical protein
VCAAGLTTKQAAGLDVLIDGALPANQIGNSIGSARGQTNVLNPFPPINATPPGVAYSETTATTWTVCMPI